MSSDAVDLGVRSEVRRGSPHPSFYRRTPYRNADWFDADLVRKARDYMRPIKRVRRLAAGLSLALSLLVVLLHLGPAVVRALPGVPWPLQLMAVLAVSSVLELLVSLPVDYWFNLVHEKKWGFGKQTLGLWVSDQAKGLLLGLILGGIFLTVIVAIIRVTPLWWVIAAGAVVVLSVVVNFLMPVVILPLFNKQQPVEGELKDRIARIAALAGVSIKRSFLMDASKRSSKDNAFVGGIGPTKRIVVFDTLLEHPGHVLDNVLAHELGHYRRKHIAVHLALGLVTGVAQFGLLAFVASFPPVLRLAGVNSIGDPAAILLLGLLLQLTSTPFTMAQMWMSRVMERQADVEALELLGNPGAVIDLWQRFAGKNLGDLEPSWYNRAKHSHPLYAERMSFARQWAELNSVPVVTPQVTETLASVLAPVAAPT